MKLMFITDKVFVGPLFVIPPKTYVPVIGIELFGARSLAFTGPAPTVDPDFVAFGVEVTDTASVQLIPCVTESDGAYYTNDR